MAKQLANAPDLCSACGEALADAADQCVVCGHLYCAACCAQPALFVSAADPAECGRCAGCCASASREREIQCAGCQELVDTHTAQLERCAQCRALYCYFCVHIDHLLVEYANDEGESLCRRCN